MESTNIDSVLFLCRAPARHRGSEGAKGVGGICRDVENKSDWKSQEEFPENVCWNLKKCYAFHRWSVFMRKVFELKK